MVMSNWRAQAARTSFIFAMSVSSAAYAQSGDTDLENLAPEEAQVQQQAQPEAAPPAPGQESAGEAAPAPKKKNLSLDEIVVTAQKRAEDVQDVPISVTAIGGETLREKNIGTVTEMSASLPNVTVGATSTFSTIYARGLGSSYNDGFEQSVGFYVDGIYMGRLTYLTDALMDIERVEMLRGPQGTLFGKNTVAGALSFTTADPAYEYLGRLDLALASRHGQKIDTMANIPVWDDRFAIRAAYQREDQKGYVENHHRGTDEVSTDKMAGKIKMRFDPTDNLKLVLSGEYSEIYDTGAGLEIIYATTDTQGFYGWFDEDFEGNANRVTWSDGKTGADRKTYGTSLHADWDIGENTVTFITGYTQFEDNATFDADVGPVPLITWGNFDEYSQWTTELRFVSAPGDFEYIVGLFAFGSQYDAFTNMDMIASDSLPSDYLSGGQYDALGDFLAEALEMTPTGDLVNQVAGDALYQTFEQSTVTYAAYAQLTGRVLPWLDLIVGIRGNMEEKEAYIKQDFENTGLTIQAMFEVEPYEVTHTRDESNIAPKVSFRAHVNDDIMFYGTIAKGFKAGGFNPFAPNAEKTTFEQEESITYEGGVKSMWWNNRMTFNIGYFYTDFQDLQVSVLTGAGTSFFVGNAATAITQGVEWEMRLVPWEGGMINYSGGYLNARYGDFRKGPCTVNEEPDADGFCDKSGGELARAPKFEMSLSLNQVVPLPVWNTGFLMGMDVSYMTEQYIDSDLDPFAVMGAYASFNVRFGIIDLDGGWRFLVSGLNVGDVDVRGTAQDMPLMAGTYFGILNEQAAWTMEAQFNF